MRLKLLTTGLLLAAVSAFAEIPFHCNQGKNLQVAIDLAPSGQTLLLTGSCSGPAVITAKNLTLKSVSNAVIEGGGKDALTVNGPSRVTLEGLTIQDGNNGVSASSGAQLIVRNSNVQKNASIGILLTGASSATLSNVTTNSNGLSGLDAEGSSAVIVSGVYGSNSNAVFGININGSSSFTLSNAQVSAAGNTLGIQIGTSASAFIADPVTTLTAVNNVTTGLTIVSGAHMVDFGGAIVATGNGVHGVSIDSKAGLDLDAAGVLSAAANQQDGVHLEETSVLTMFNTTAFSGAPGTTTLNATGNMGNGVSILTGSNLTVIHQAALNSTGNTHDGIQVDNGSSLTLIQSNVTSNARDIVFTFGSRGDITGSTVGTVSCDATVLLRGSYSKCPM